MRWRQIYCMHIDMKAFDKVWWITRNCVIIVIQVSSCILSDAARCQLRWKFFSICSDFHWIAIDARSQFSIDFTIHKSFIWVLAAFLLSLELRISTQTRQAMLCGWDYTLRLQVWTLDGNLNDENYILTPKLLKLFHPSKQSLYDHLGQGHGNQSNYCCGQRLCHVDGWWTFAVRLSSALTQSKSFPEI